MIELETQGAFVILEILDKIKKKIAVTNEDFNRFKEKNDFFIGFYGKKEGVDEGRIARTLINLNENEENYLLKGLRQGFLTAYENLDKMKRTLRGIKDMNLYDVEKEVLKYLPPNTPLDFKMHTTVDGYNRSFHYKDEMGISIIFTLEPQIFRSKLTHELHHVGISHHLEKNTIIAKIMAEKNSFSIFIQFILHLLSEGLANYYCYPGLDIFGISKLPDRSLSEGLEKKIMDYKSNEERIFRDLETRLLLSLVGKSYDESLKLYKEVAIDEKGILPVLHYTGARMIETMDAFYSLEDIVECIVHPEQFILKYQDAAKNVNDYVFSDVSINAYLKEIKIRFHSTPNDR
jgi:hypothetical protein